MLHPAVLFTGVWGLTVALYLMNLSDLLRYAAADVMQTVGPLVASYLAGILAGTAAAAYLASRPGGAVTAAPANLDRLAERMMMLFALWAGATLVEIAASGGVPLLWLMTGSSKNYFSFGIHSVHGLLDSIVLSLSLVSFYLYLERKERRFLRIPVFVTAWALIVISRNMLIVNLLQLACLFLCFRTIRVHQAIKLGVGAIIVLLVFGYIGDARTGARAFLDLAQPTSKYPLWLPSGFLWAYMYIASPLNNLVNTVVGTPIHGTLTLVNTTATLLPSVVRGAVVSSTAGMQGALVASAFNVSTAFVGPYLDMGMIGMCLYALLLGFASLLVWRKRTAKGYLYYSVIAQATVLSIFFNHFLYLPILFQCVWIAVLFAPRLRY